VVDVLYAAGIGVLAGLIPVYLGLIPMPLFRKLSAARRNILISFSIGILLFLFVDVTKAAFDLVKAPKITGSGLFALGFTFGLLGPAMFSHSRRRQRESSEPKVTPSRTAEGRFFTAYMIAIGIGLHNFGEGLALGAAYAASNFALTGVLVLGFALHNGTEGMGIGGPIADLPVRGKEIAFLGLLAGIPTVLGSIVGSIAYSDLLGVLLFSAAGGAILYVIVELGRFSYSPRGTFLGVWAGLLLMYFTELILSV
jgi:ZIP family zinc transporter